MSRASALVAPVALAAAAACLTAAPAAQADWAPSFRSAHIARVMTSTAARTRPGAGKVVWRVPTQTTWTRAGVRLLVLGSARDRRGRLWLRVRLPIRPGNARGWVNADHVRTHSTGWRVVLHTSSRTVSVYRAGKLRRRFGAVIGTPSTPTPRGLFAIWERSRQADPSAFLGPWALHLTAHSDVLQNFGGGPGRVAIHGRSGASLSDPLGSARSHGCIRVDNRQIRWLAHVAAAGTPVAVRR